MSIRHGGCACKRLRGYGAGGMTRRVEATRMSALFGGIEGGGTKFVCVIGTGPDDIRAHETFPTTSPEETLGAAADFFARRHADSSIAALGIGCFGPLDLDPA